MKKLKKVLLIITLVALMASVLPVPYLGLQNNASAAAVNLVADGNFNQDIYKSWYLWKGANSLRSYELARSYETPFGYGPYSMSVSATGQAGALNDGGLTSIDSNRYLVASDKNYNLSFSVRATTESTISVHLENAQTYQTVTQPRELTVTTGWSKQQVVLTPTASGLASLVISVGSIPDGAKVYFDNLNLFENDATLVTTKVSGNIGNQKSVIINNGNLFTLDEIKIELPYVNSETGVSERKQFSPISKTNTTVNFIIPEQTYSGIGKVLVGTNVIGQFDYEILVNLKEVNPNPVLVDEDLVIYGTGFSPDLNQNFVVLKATDVQGRVTEKWVKPHMIDKELTQMIVKLPVGIVSAQLNVRTYYNNATGAGVELKSNPISYAIKPVIYNLAWTKSGYEQIGDKITITGKGIAGRPAVKFYDEEGKLISSAAGVVKTINEESGSETIEVITPRLLNKLQVTVKTGDYESDKANALNYTARPILQSIQSSNSRKTTDSNIIIAAAKPGATIKMVGQGFKAKGGAYVIFPGLNDGRIRVYVPVEKIDVKGNSLEVVVPKGAQNGQVSLEINEQESNQLSLEIIPSIISQTPLIPSPGQEMTFWTNGVGLNRDLTTVHFQLNTREVVKVKPVSLTVVGEDVVVKVLVPRAISNDGSAIKLQYGEWTNNQLYNLQTNPVIERASIDLDTKVLKIYGYGFSNTLAENKMNFKYADGTSVSPKISLQSIQTSREGQELNVKILDGYYYGYVSLTVDSLTSNEVNVGPAVITRIDRRVQFVASENRVMGVLYISGRNFGAQGDVRVGSVWADTHYRTNSFIIAVVEVNNLNSNPVIVTKK